MPRPSDEYTIEQALRRQKEYLAECEREIKANEDRVTHYRADKAATERRIKALEQFMAADSEPLPPCEPFREPGAKKRKMNLRDDEPQYEAAAE